MLKDPFVRSKFISSPTNFSHLAHMGPGDGRPEVPAAPEEKGRGRGRNHGPTRPHSFSEALRRPASMGSEVLAAESEAVRRKPRTSLSSESVSCSQGPLSPAASLSQVRSWEGLGSGSGWDPRKLCLLPSASSLPLPPKQRIPWENHFSLINNPIDVRHIWKC
ncbi:serine/threonine-protein kinase MRCK gamma-like [Gracilinanus agilis]|uniref:serine/threonine-protein kinase MRCK gamma-like n=1 Tax=Gracilinanus agilis TaxID=191870 RepID=UPI001CFE218F|nr:serine/threonine-protein kinase MRCK gamma-like [Gracilinanus agilis]